MDIDKYKYVILSDGDLHFPIIFPPYLEHKKVREKFSEIKEVIGAGFIKKSNDPEDRTLYAYGKSESLNVKSRGDEDTEILNQFFNERRK